MRAVIPTWNLNIFYASRLTQIFAYFHTQNNTRTHTTPLGNTENSKQEWLTFTFVAAAFYYNYYYSRVFVHFFIELKFKWNVTTAVAVTSFWTEPRTEQLAVLAGISCGWGSLRRSPRRVRSLARLAAQWELRKLKTENRSSSSTDRSWSWSREPSAAASPAFHSWVWSSSSELFPKSSPRTEAGQPVAWPQPGAGSWESLGILARVTRVGCCQARSDNNKLIKSMLFQCPFLGWSSDTLTNRRCHQGCEPLKVRGSRSWACPGANLVHLPKLINACIAPLSLFVVLPWFKLVCHICRSREQDPRQRMNGNGTGVELSLLTKKVHWHRTESNRRTQLIRHDYSHATEIRLNLAKQIMWLSPVHWVSSFVSFSPPHICSRWG